MKRKSLKLFMLLFIACSATSLFYSCSKDDAFQSNVLETDIVKFKTLEEYHDALNAVLSMTTDERKSYEESQGYISFGRQCDEFYDEIDWDKFESLEEIKAFAATNDFIKVLEDDDGEIIIESMLSSRPDRYFINADRIFQVGDYVYKTFEDGTASTHIDNLHKLLNNKSFSVNTIPEDTEIFVSRLQPYNHSNLKDAIHNCGKKIDFANTSDCNGYRVGMEIETELRDVHGSDWKILYVAANLRSFRRTWRGLVYSNRTVEYRAKVAVDLKLEFGWNRDIYEKNETRSVDGKYTHMFEQRWVEPWYPYPNNVDAHFAAYDCFVSMVGHPGAEAQGTCNKHLVPTPWQ